jgi:DNA-binding transcriptional ArsR family regulator
MVESRAFNLDQIFQALSDPTRRSILRKLARRERAVGEIAESYSMSLAAVSKHIQNLERAGLITRRRDGSFSYIKLNPAGISSADKWLEYYRGFWQQNLNSLKNFIENEDK